MAGFSDSPLIQDLAVPGVCLLIAFLSYVSQLVFHRATTLEPGPPSRGETVVFNLLLAALWITYYRTVTTDPGRYVFPEKVMEVDTTQRWCKKCAAPKPPRAHHCRHCERCVPRMDHHCPWTANCVSFVTFPHFLRFLVFANLSLWNLGYFLWQRFAALWDDRNMPAYLGPTLVSLIALAVIALVWFVTSLALGIMLVNTIRGWALNQTMIEGWEIDRHEVVAARGGRDWWDVVGADGEKMRFEKIEFPYDVGIYANMSQALGTSNPLLWLNPFAGTLRISEDGKGAGWDWEENGFNREEGMWPPLDPEKVRRAARNWPAGRRDFAAELRAVDNEENTEDRKEAFRRRQEEDFKRKQRIIADLEEVGQFDDLEEEDEDEDENEDDDESDGDEEDDEKSPTLGISLPWVNSDGDRLHDYGVDEDAEDGIDDDVPLAELLRRRKNTRHVDEDDDA